MVTMAQLRQQARDALKNNWQIALLVAFIAALPGIISQMVTILQGNTLADMLLRELQSGIFYSTTDPGVITEQMLQAQLGSTAVLRNVVAFISWLITPFLTLGMLNYLQQLLDGQTGYITDVFARRQCFFKGIGLQIMTILKIALWTLPGLALMIASLMIGLSGWNENGSLSTLLLILLFASYFVMLVPAVMATYRYTLSMNVMAEHPDYGIMQCINASKAIMKDRKFMLFTLQLSFIGWMLLLIVIEMIVTALLGNVLGNTVYMFMSLALNVYMQTSICAFYKVSLAEAA